MQPKLAGLNLRTTESRERPSLLQNKASATSLLPTHSSLSGKKRGGGGGALRRFQSSFQKRRCWGCECAHCSLFGAFTAMVFLLLGIYAVAIKFVVGIAQTNADATGNAKPTGMFEMDFGAATNVATPAQQATTAGAATTIFLEGVPGEQREELANPSTYFARTPLDIIDAYDATKCSLKAARWAEEQLKHTLGTDASQMLHFLHVPRTAGRTKFFCAIKPRFSKNDQCPKAYDHLRLSEMVRGCKAMASHDDFSVKKFLPSNTAYTTTVRRPVDRVLSAYEFATEIALRAYGQSDEERKRKTEQAKKNGRIATTDVWPWSGLIPIAHSEWKRRTDTHKSDLQRLKDSAASMTPAQASALANAYDFPGFQSLRDFVEDPRVADLLQDGSTMQLLGLTNYSSDPMATELRRCVVQQRDEGAREVLMYVALKRLREFVHVSIFDRLDESIELLYAQSGWNLNNDPAIGKSAAMMGAQQDESSSGRSLQTAEEDDGDNHDHDVADDTLARKTRERRSLQERLSSLPEPWSRYESEKYVGHIFYHNPETNESSWSHPDPKLLTDRDDPSPPAPSADDATSKEADVSKEAEAEAKAKKEAKAAALAAERADLERKVKEALKTQRRAEFKRYRSLEERRDDEAKLSAAVKEAEANLKALDEKIAEAENDESKEDSAESSETSGASEQSADESSGPVRQIKAFGNGEPGMGSFFRKCSTRSGSRAKAKRVSLHQTLMEQYGIPLEFSKRNRAALPANLIDRMNELNAMDNRLYAFASKLFEARLDVVRQRTDAPYIRLPPNPTERLNIPVLGSAERAATGARKLTSHSMIPEPTGPPKGVLAQADESVSKVHSTPSGAASLTSSSPASRQIENQSGDVQPKGTEPVTGSGLPVAPEGAKPAGLGVSSPSPAAGGGGVLPTAARERRRKTIMGNRAPQGPAIPPEEPAYVDIFADADALSN